MSESLEAFLVYTSVAELLTVCFYYAFIHVTYYDDMGEPIDADYYGVAH